MVCRDTGAALELFHAPTAARMAERSVLPVLIVNGHRGKSTAMSWYPWTSPSIPFPR